MAFIDALKDHNPRDQKPSAKPQVYRERGKRIFDIFFVFLTAPIVVPVVVVVAIIVGLDGGTAFFGHERIGKNGRKFKCFKIRTMVPNAEARLEEYLVANPELRREWQQEFKLKNDPRITWLGRFLRKTSLDELPQFFNVLRGDLSVVGPRPVTSSEMEQYGDAAADVLSIRPGITGLWQVSGRNNTSYAERVQLDLAYVRNFTLGADLSIISKTITVVLRPTGV